MVAVGEYYRHKSSPDYCWAKVLNIFKAKQHPNNQNYKVVECLWVTSKSNNVGLVKCFKASDLIQKEQTK